MSRHEVYIELHGGRGTISLDGRLLKGVTAFTVTSEAGKPAQVTLTLMPESLHLRVYGELPTIEHAPEADDG